MGGSGGIWLIMPGIALMLQKMKKRSSKFTKSALFVIYIETMHVLIKDGSYIVPRAVEEVNVFL